MFNLISESQTQAFSSKISCFFFFFLILMGSESCHKLAFIDFNGVEPETQQWNSVKAQVFGALKEYGCFEASFKKVSPAIRTALFQSLQELFDLPLQTKMKNISNNPYHGFVGNKPNLPLYESLGIDNANVLKKVESLSNTYWPEGNSSFNKTIQSFTEQVSELEKITRRMILESLGVEKYLDELLDSTYYAIRVMKYTGPLTTDTELGLHSHTDKNIVTILYQNKVDGLEVQAKDGEWFPVKPLPDSFIILIGDSLEAWTNGRLCSPNHRVMMRGNNVRYSIALFSNPKPEIIMEAPKELVDEEHPPLFKPFNHVEFVQFYMTEAGRKAKSALKAYCGTDNL